VSVYTVWGEITKVDCLVLIPDSGFTFYFMLVKVWNKNVELRYHRQSVDIYRLPELATPAVVCNSDRWITHWYCQTVLLAVLC